MPDCYSANISIGGKVTARQWQRICKDDELFQLFDPQKPEHVGCDGEVWVGTTGTLEACDPQASWGAFNCEDYLVEQGIPFDRETDPDYGNDGVAVAFRPGMKGKLEVTADADGDPVVSFDQLDRFFARLGEVGDAKFEELGDGYTLHRVRKDQPLPPFEYVPWKVGDFEIGEKVALTTVNEHAVFVVTKRGRKFVTLTRTDGEYAGKEIKLPFDEGGWEPVE